MIIVSSKFVKLFSSVASSYSYLFSKFGEYSPSVHGAILLYRDYVILQDYVILLSRTSY